MLCFKNKVMIDEIGRAVAHAYCGRTSYDVTNVAGIV